MKIKDYLNRNSGVRIQGDTAVLDVFGFIGMMGFDFASWNIEYDNRQNTVMRKIRELAEIDDAPVKKLVLNINSLGGYTEHAIALYEFISSLGLELETRCFGQAASAATILAQCGKKRTISANARYLIHRCWADTSGNRFEFEQAAEMLEQTDNRIINLYATRSGKNAAAITEVMNRNGGNGVWLTPEETVALGLADEIVPAMEAVASASPRALKMFSLPDLPEVAAAPDNLKPSKNEAKGDFMDKETINKANGLFGASFTVAALGEGLEFPAMLEKYATESKARIGELETENTRLQGELDTAKADLAAAQAKNLTGGEPPTVPAAPAEPESTKNEPAPIKTVAGLVKNAWNKKQKKED